MDKKIWISIIIIIVVILTAVVLRLIIFNPSRPSKGGITISCKFPVRISGDSMEPALKSGSIVFADKCFNEKDLKIGTIVVFKDRNTMILSRIGQIQGNEYYVKPDNRDREEIIEIDNIVGIIEK